MSLSSKILVMRVRLVDGIIVLSRYESMSFHEEDVMSRANLRCAFGGACESQQAATGRPFEEGWKGEGTGKGAATVSAQSTWALVVLRFEVLALGSSAREACDGGDDREEVPEIV